MNVFTSASELGSASQSPGVSVPARTIPAPKTISAQAQAFLGASGMFPDGPPPAPDDLEGWRAHIEAGNAGLTFFTKQFADEYPGAISEHQLSASMLYEVEPASLNAAAAECVILYVHGGGFTVGHGIAAAYAAHKIAGMTGVRTYSTDYRMPPDHPFPAGLDDGVEAYRFLLERYAPEKIVVYGASAGGGLAGSLILKARDSGLPLPAACVLASPEADLTETGDSFETNELIDVVLKRRLTNSILLYANSHDLTDPYLSPVLGDFSKGFPPTLFTTGTRDLFLSNSVRFHRALRQQNIEAELHVWEAMPHGGFFGAPEDQETYEEQARFIKRRLKLD